MEAAIPIECPPEAACWQQLDPPNDLASWDEDDVTLSTWSDDILDELRGQAPDGCLLCSLDQWNEEDFADA